MSCPAPDRLPPILIPTGTVKNADESCMYNAMPAVCTKAERRAHLFPASPPLEAGAPSPPHSPLPSVC
ncbi:hypothetical protein CKAH01_05813 [Colletotrichum kahawae]|uniref:Uncharacterized protein n=1 Tax=Colletotrichum kahawae TaxID=34407 RepID=A0AAD9YEV9_COLKA|nr:hypothetical protein CKAH01_05813 [Colletotrichum kahawae]